MSEPDKSKHIVRLRVHRKYSGDERRLLALVAAKFGLGPKVRRVLGFL